MEVTVPISNKGFCQENSPLEGGGALRLDPCYEFGGDPSL